MLEELGGWARVVTAYGYPGWVRGELLGGAPDACRLRPKASDPVEHARTLLGARYVRGGMTAACRAI